MGVIKRQSIKQSILSYFGVGIGFISTLWIYPLDLEIYGLAQFLLGSVGLLIPLLNLGISSLSVRFFPLNSKENTDKGFLTLLSLLSLITFSIIGGLIFTFKEAFVNFLVDINAINDDSISTYIESILILSLIIIFIRLFTSYVANYLRIVIPYFLDNIFMKIVLPILVLTYFWNYISKTEFVFIFISAHVFILISIFIYTLKVGNLSFKIDKSIITKKLNSSMFKFSSIAIIGGLGSMLVFKLDAVMIGSMISMKQVGVYSMMLFIANVIELPFKSVNSIAGPIISTSWKTNNTSEIFKIYKKSSLNLLIIGVLIFSIIFVNIEDIFKLTSKYDTLMLGKNALIFLGLAKIIDMTTGVNNQIIGLSKYYYFNLVAIVVLGITSVFTNYYFIGIYGISGAAIATLISLTVFNFVKFIFIWKAFKMQPFELRHLTAILLILVGAIASYYFPDINIILIPLIVKTGLLVGISIPLLYYFKVSEEFNSTLEEGMLKIRKFFR